MSTVSFIRRFIFKTAKDRIFTTRECLIYGKRSAVDYALHTLVKKEIILRLARGIFVRNNGKIPQFSPAIIAEIKARAFGKEIITHASELAKKLGINQGSNANYKFAVNGSTSSFRYGEITIHLKHIGQRAMKLGESKAGQAARLLWHLGKEKLSPDLIKKATDNFLRPDREDLRRAVALMPAWLSGSFMQRVRWLPKAP